MFFRQKGNNNGRKLGTLGMKGGQRLQCPACCSHLLMQLQSHQGERRYLVIHDKPLWTTLELCSGGNFGETPKDGGLWLEGCDLESSPPSTSREGRGAGDRIQSPMANGWSIIPVQWSLVKIQKDRVQRASWLVNGDSERAARLQGMGTLRLIPHTSP